MDALIIKDVLCGSDGRPCPKYPNGTKHILGVAPCIFFFPQKIPNEKHPKPRVHNITTLTLPKIILETFEVKSDDYEKHIFRVFINVFRTNQGLLKRQTIVKQRNSVIEKRIAGV